MKPRITVLVGQRAHPVSGRLVRSPGDATALSLALQTVGPEHVRVLSAGQLADEVARAYLAQGARTIEVLQQASGEDMVATLSRAIEASPAGTGDLVFTGLRGEADLGSGSLPYALARQLRCQVMRDVVALQAEGSAWRLTQALPKGARRQWRLMQPAVLAIHPSAAVTARHAHVAMLQGQVVHAQAPQAVVPVAAQGLTDAWQRVPAAKRLLPLEAARQQSGHSRMLGAIGGDTAAPAQVLKGMTPAEQAQAIFQYLQDHALLPF